MPVYITDITAFLPNPAVANDQMEQLLGMVNQLPSRTKRIILRNNGIKSRHYAIDPATGAVTHTNAQLAAEAIRRLQPYADFSPDQIECLCCGTSMSDQLMPGHAPMVHGELRSAPLEAVSTAGVCLAGITALKYAWMNVSSGQNRNAVATGSEVSSNAMKARQMKSVAVDKINELESNNVLSFEEDFLRWMLSDGAGAAFLTADHPGQGKLALQIDWIEIVSFANELEVCMYAGANKLADGTLRGWQHYDGLEAIQQGIFNVKQDVKLLNSEIIKTATERTLPRIIKKHGLRSDQIDWFLPHYSSNYFRKPLQEGMIKVGMDIPEERWFTNLAEKGNTGSASIYIILEELFHSGRLKKGEKLLCFIPESARFSIAYMQLTVC
ncbi:MAG: beta-ketoacyl-ACP synthase III [Desulfuromonadales bacterium]|nr:beta-ketoacyl-ACP synthase III [Desulfuromonadales bacterium]